VTSSSQLFRPGARRGSRRRPVRGRLLSRCGSPRPASSPSGHGPRGSPPARRRS
jgi:hypothetical protein